MTLNRKSTAFILSTGSQNLIRLSSSRSTSRKQRLNNGVGPADLYYYQHLGDLADFDLATVD
jgi:hypothetical protein